MSPRLAADRIRSSRVAPFVAFVAVLALAFAGLRTFYHLHPALYDTDSSFHLAAGRAYADEGLGWAPPLRLSLLGPRDDVSTGESTGESTGRQYGDKELLFHVLIAPWTLLHGDGLGDRDDGSGESDRASPRAPLAAGKSALALFGALLLATLAALGVRAAGARWGALLPLWLVWSSTEFDWRLVRLRPELFALALLCVALWAAATRRAWLLGALAAVFALSYTAIHAFCGLFALLFFVWGLGRRRWEWDMAAAVALGAGLGLVIHPHFPVNLEVWVAQNVSFFVEKGDLDVGTEIRPHTTDVVLMVNLAWWLGLWALWRSRRPDQSSATGGSPTRRDHDRRLADAFTLAAFVFGVLYLLMSRFVLYALPLLALALLFTIQARGERAGPGVPLWGRLRVPTVAVFVALAFLATPELLRQLDRYAERTAGGPEDARFTQLAAFSAALPDGAHVAAPWGRTALYLLWAPQGEYLNALDPVFMASIAPEAYELQRAVFDGTWPDVPLASVDGLDSEHLAVPVTQPGALLERLAHDPRVETLHRASNLLVRFRPAEPSRFVVDGWQVRDLGTTSRAHPVQGYVDLRTALGEGPGAPAAVDPCVLATHAPLADAGRFELAPAGATELWLDDESALRVGGVDAVLGRGVQLAIPEGRRLTIRTCAAPNGHVGFYLLRRR